MQVQDRVKNPLPNQNTWVSVSVTESVGFTKVHLHVSALARQNIDIWQPCKNLDYNILKLNIS